MLLPLPPRAQHRKSPASVGKEGKEGSVEAAAPAPRPHQRRRGRTAGRAGVAGATRAPAPRGDDWNWSGRVRRARTLPAPGPLGLSHASGGGGRCGSRPPAFSSGREMLSLLAGFLSLHKGIGTGLQYEPH
jgi:hypothetical protein